MRVKHFAVVIALAALVLMPLTAQVQPGDAEDKTALDVIEEHEELTITYDLFAPEFGEFLDGEEQLALFAPTDEVLEGVDAEELSYEEIESLFHRHMTTGIATEYPIEFIEWFGTADGAEIAVYVEDETVTLNDVAAVVEAIPTTNGVVYVIDQSLES